MNSMESRLAPRHSNSRPSAITLHGVTSSAPLWQQRIREKRMIAKMTAIPHRRDRVHIPADPVPVRVHPRNSLSQLSFLLDTPRPGRSHLTILPRAVLGRPYVRGPHPGTRVTVNASTPIRSCRHHHRRCRNHQTTTTTTTTTATTITAAVTVLYRSICCCCAVVATAAP